MNRTVIQMYDIRRQATAIVSLSVVVVLRIATGQDAPVGMPWVILSCFKGHVMSGTGDFLERRRRRMTWAGGVCLGAICCTLMNCWFSYRAAESYRYAEKHPPKDLPPAAAEGYRWLIRLARFRNEGTFARFALDESAAVVASAELERALPRHCFVETRVEETKHTTPWLWSIGLDQQQPRCLDTATEVGDLLAEAGCRVATASDAALLNRVLRQLLKNYPALGDRNERVGEFQWHIGTDGHRYFELNLKHDQTVESGTLISKK